MCTISGTGDHFFKKWEDDPFVKGIIGTTRSYIPEVSKLEFEELKAEFKEMKELLKKAKILDDTLGTPDCENEEKFEMIRKLAKVLEVDLEDVLNT